MRTYLAAFLLAALASAALTPLVRLIAIRLQAMSATGGRHMHARKIPRLGGVAIAIALFLPILSLFVVDGVVAQHIRENALRVVGLCGGGALLCLVGALDDIRGVRALSKLLAQILVATLAWGCGFRIDEIMLPVFGVLPMGIFSLPVTVLWVVGITNAVNLIDGLDGLAAGVVFFAGVTNFVVAHSLGRQFTALAMAALLGAVLAFLFYNFNPARIFMGDSGSYLLGYVLATTALVGPTGKATTAVSLLVPIVALGVPIFDTLFAMVRRALERRPIFSPDRGHIHHRLLDLGLTHRRAVLFLYGVSVLLTVASIAIYLGRAWQIGVALLGATVVMAGLVRFVGYFSIAMFARRQRSRMRSRDAELLRHAVLSAFTELAAAHTEEQLLEALEAVAERAELASLEVRPRGLEEATFRWAPRTSDARRVVATMTYPLGRDSLADHEVEIAVVTEFEDAEMPPQTEILLQLFVDLLVQNLARVGSRFAPRVVPQPAPRASAGERAPVSGRPAVETGLDP
ncbi:MAG: undecaprenyl/decaprenyl-phosphate alpha-N-acetylglucosaminyl 1-phosphate transferase [Deltaproteobacteria bacterium]|nr:undecaprenyl/decaprenyl-phosphate alpha-N-acetylglucosaminyl 1-phosphate transferase [Deltaproteobacteria bacterium]